MRLVKLGFALNFPAGCEQRPLEIASSNLYTPYDPNNKMAIYRWNHPFSLPLRVEAEP